MLSIVDIMRAEAFRVANLQEEEIFDRVFDLFLIKRLDIKLNTLII